MLYLGESIDPETSAQVQASMVAIEEALRDDLVDLVPSYASVLIIYDALRTDHLSVTRRVRTGLENLAAKPRAAIRTVVLPVYYAAETGADLEAVAARAGLSIGEVIALHCDLDYQVYAIGFAPGFAYLGQVDKRISMPRLATPRATVPKGSVAIADRQTAVYPAISPGGWNLIGCCPVAMFEPQANPSMPVAVGDRVRFEAISREQFLNLGGILS
jgi:KipI family sensor histidine kinase inhibitor